MNVDWKRKSRDKSLTGVQSNYSSKSKHWAVDPNNASDQKLIKEQLSTHYDVVAFYKQEQLAVNILNSNGLSDYLENNNIPEELSSDFVIIKPKLPSNIEDIKIDNPVLYNRYINHFQSKYKDYLSMVKDRNQIEKDFNFKMQLFYKTMSDVYGHQVLSRVASWIKKRLYFEAFWQLHEFFLKEDPTTKSEQIDNILLLISWTGTCVIGVFVEHICMLLDLKGVLNEHEISEQLKVAEIKKIIKRSNPKNTYYFSVPLKMLDRDLGISLAELSSELENAQREMVNTRDMRKLALQWQSPSSSTSSYEVNNLNPDIRQPIKCYDCGKPGVKMGHDGCTQKGKHTHVPKELKDKWNKKSSLKDEKKAVSSSTEAHNVLHVASESSPIDNIIQIQNKNIDLLNKLERKVELHSLRLAEVLNPHDDNYGPFEYHMNLRSSNDKSDWRSKSRVPEINTPARSTRRLSYGRHTQHLDSDDYEVLEHVSNSSNIISTKVKTIEHVFHPSEKDEELYNDIINKLCINTPTIRKSQSIHVSKPSRSQFVMNLDDELLTKPSASDIIEHIDDNYELDVDQSAILRDALGDNTMVDINISVPQAHARKLQRALSIIAKQMIYHLDQHINIEEELYGIDDSSNEIHMLGRKAYTRNDIPDVECVLPSIMDSGSANHAWKHHEGFRNFKHINDHTVLLGGKPELALQVVGRGDYGILKNVDHVEGLHRNLVSTPQLCLDGHISIFNQFRCFVYSINDRRLVMSATLARGTNLFHIDIKANGPTYLQLLMDEAALIGMKVIRKDEVPNTEPHVVETKSPIGESLETIITTDIDVPTVDTEIIDTESQPTASNTTIKKASYEERLEAKCKSLNITKSDFICGSSQGNRKNLVDGLPLNQLIHNRLNHCCAYPRLYMAANNLTCLGLNATLDEIKNSGSYPCAWCYYASFKKFPAPPAYNLTADQLKYTVLADTKGKFKIRTKSGYKWALIWLHGSSRYFGVQFGATKSVLLQQIPLLQENQLNSLGITMRYFRTDSDAIFKNRLINKWKVKDNITLQYTAPYRKEGMMESHMQIVWNPLKATMIQYQIPPAFMDIVLEHGIMYIMNRLPNASHPDSCAITDLTNTIPDLSHLKPIGQYCLAKVYDEEINSDNVNTPHAFPCQILGFSNETKNAYIVRSLDNNKLYVRKDVVCFENITKDRLPGDELFWRAPNAVYSSEDYDLVQADCDSDGTDEIEDGPVDDSDIQLESESSQPIIADESVLRRHRPRAVSMDDHRTRRVSTRVPVPSRLLDQYELNSTEQVEHTNHVRFNDDEVGTLRSGVEFINDGSNEKVIIRPPRKPPPSALATAAFNSELVPGYPPLPPPLPRLLWDPDNPPEEFPDYTKAVNTPGTHQAYWIEAGLKEINEIGTRGVVVNPSAIVNIKKSKPFRSKMLCRCTKELVETVGLEGIKKLEVLIKFKVRMVVKGYTQLFGIHYTANASPTIAWKAILVMLHIAAVNGWYRKHIDIGNAFLEAALVEDLFMYMPKEWTEGMDIIVKLARNLYGFKQAGLMWYLCIRQVLYDLGFERSIYDPCVFYKMNADVKMFIGIHVDDKALLSSSLEYLDIVKQKLAERFKKITDLGELHRYIGVTIVDDGTHWCLSQEDHISDLVKHDFDNSKPTHYPVPTEYNNKVREFDVTDAILQPIWDENGMINYIACHTRPGVACVSGVLAKYAPKPRQVHIDALNHVKRYLYHTKNMALKLGGSDKKIKLFGYVDASHCKDGDSKGRYCIIWFLSLDSGSVGWKSGSFKLVHLNSTEAEVDGFVESIKDLIWYRGLLLDLGCYQDEPTIIYQDGNSAVALYNKEVAEGRTRHIINRLNFIHQYMELGIVKPVHISDKFMVADFGTKFVDGTKHQFCEDIAMNGHHGRAPGQSY